MQCDPGPLGGSVMEGMELSGPGCCRKCTQLQVLEMSDLGTPAVCMQSTLALGTAQTPEAFSFPLRKQGEKSRPEVRTNDALPGGHARLACPPELPHSHVLQYPCPCPHPPLARLTAGPWSEWPVKLESCCHCSAYSAFSPCGGVNSESCVQHKATLPSLDFAVPTLIPC